MVHILCSQTRLKSSMATSSQVPLPYFQVRARIDNLPYDVTIMIFELLNVCSQTCLGVTCKSLYGDLQKLQPEEISLYANVECSSSKHTFLSSHPDEERLDYLLQDWEGLKGYRLAKFHGANPPIRQWWFLNKAVYGEKVNQDLEGRLWRRWWDYLCSPATGQYGYLVSPINDHPTRDIKEMLPRPFKMSGEEWYAEVVKIIKDDVHCWKDWTQWYKFWAHTVVFLEDKKEEFEEMIEELLKLRPPSERIR